MLAALLALLKNPKTSSREFKIELEKLRNGNGIEKDVDFAAVLNGNIDSEDHLLNLALECAPLDTVFLLFDHGCQSNPASQSALEKRAVGGDEDAIAKEKIVLLAALEFFNFLQDQESLAPELLLNTAFGLIRESMTHLSAVGTQEEAILFLGKTGAGKSTLTNVLRGRQYQIDDDEVFQDEPIKPLVLTNNSDESDKEETETSASSFSKTSYPIVLPSRESKNLHFVDMPGFQDTRGPAHEIAAGLSAMCLQRHFQSLRMLALVFDANDIADTRGVLIQDHFKALARILQKNPVLAKNAILVINKVPDDKSAWEVARFIRLLEKRITGFSSDEKACLAPLLTPEKTILIPDVPGDTFKAEFLAHAAKNTPIPMTEFDFSCFTEKMPIFTKALEHLEAFRANAAREVAVATNSMLQPILAKLKAQREAVSKPFETDNFDPAQSKAKGVADFVQAQQAYETGRTANLAQLDKYIKAYSAQIDPSITEHYVGDLDVYLALNIEKLTIAEGFLSAIAPILAITHTGNGLRSPAHVAETLFHHTEGGAGSRAVNEVTPQAV